MSPEHGEAAAATTGGGQSDGATSSVRASRDTATEPRRGPATFAELVAAIGRQLDARRQAAARLAPLPDGRRDPDLELDHPRTIAGPCSRSYACLAQPLEVLERVHHCPCAEAEAALKVVNP